MLSKLKTLLKDTSIYALGNLSGKVVGFILLPFYVEKLTTAEYGMLGTMEATFQLIAAISGLCLGVALTRWYWDKEIVSKQKSVFFTTLCSVTVFAIFTSVCVFPFAPSVSQLLFDNIQYSRLVRLMVAAAGLEIIAQIPATLCKLQQKPVMYTRTIMIRLIIVLGLTLLFVVVLNRKVEGIYEAQIIGTLAYMLLFLPYTIRNSTLHFETGILKKMLNFSFPFILSSFFGVFLGIADRYSLNFISGLTSVGIYALGYKLANTLKIFIVTSVQLALTPTVFRMVDKPEIKRFLSKIMTYFTFGLMFCALGVSLFGQEAVKLMTAKQPEYWNAYMIIPFIALGIVFGMMKDQAAYGLHIVKRTGIMASIIIFVSSLNIVLNIVLISLTGIIGAAISTVLSQIVYFAAMYYFAHRHYPVPYEFRKVFLAIGTGILFCCVAYLIRNQDLAVRLCVKTALLAGFPLILYLFRCYDKNELQALSGFWKKWKNPQTWKRRNG